MNKVAISNVTLTNLEKVRTSSSRLRNFFGILNQLPSDEVAIFGGAVRDWHLGKTPKDIDIVIKESTMETIEKLTKNFDCNRSKFDGYHFEVSGIHLDVWRLQDSWYFRDRNVPKVWAELAASVPFDVDAILVFRDGFVVDRGFAAAMDKKQIELQNMINKDPKIHIFQRALRFRNKYGFTFGPKLQEAMHKYKDSESDAYKEAWKLASNMEVQQQRFSSN